MSTYDFASYTCPVCGHHDEAETIVDIDFAHRMEAHIESHNLKPQERAKQ